jgi:hypothetical protein
MHEDLGGDISVVGKYIGVLRGAETIADAAQKVRDYGAWRVGEWIDRQQKSVKELLIGRETLYCGAEEVNGVYVRFDIQEDT